MPLHRPRLLADRRLGDAVQFGRFRETLRLDQVGKDFEVFNLHEAKLAAAHFDRVQSVDSEKLLVLLDRAAAEAGKVLPVLLQINAGADPAKFGAEPADAPRLLEPRSPNPRCVSTAS
jgi:hypothetical protein